MRESRFRSILSVSTKKLLQENADVAKWFVAGLTALNVGKLASGEGRIVKMEGDRGRRVPQQARVHALSAKCTHLGCLVAFNTAKDLGRPRHGSQFNIGSVIQGPALEALVVPP